MRAALEDLAPGALFRHCHPFGDLDGPGAFYDAAYAPLLAAWPDLERRDWIVMAGPDGHGNDWVGCGGTYVGTFKHPWLDIPPTGHFTTMRFHEFYRFEDGKVVEVQAIWDIPEVMMQAGAWPLAPSLGREGLVPGPATQDGLVPGPYDAEKGAATCQHIVDMLDHMKRHPSQGGPEVMEMPRFWHERMTWYGPAGIGTGRGIKGFRDWHQIPFLAGMPDRGQYLDEITYHFFGDGDYAAVTGWPNMVQTISHPGWLGIAPTGQEGHHALARFLARGGMARYGRTGCWWTFCTCMTRSASMPSRGCASSTRRGRASMTKRGGRCHDPATNPFLPA